MSYQVLARKWRPKSFSEMAGQEHVLKALINALDRNRLHHAYLFTGTRGVGKTTIARILAKCLNCDKGVTSTPCGECSPCQQIAEGRFIDLIEVDAASRTKVEDTRELLDNVQYAPTAGRYKVYLIDEVHMLSNSSFNALLKTLEEPPPHVKFLLATTDPQKLPATVLSRCLQFNLKNMSPERIVKHLDYVLGEEQIEFDEQALWSLSRAAEGSMRDALSLTDQAIAYGSGQVRADDVTMMLGTIDQHAVYRLLLALAAQNGAQLLAEVALMAEHAADFGSALEEMLSVLHRLAIAQSVPAALDNSHGDRQRIIELASQMTAEDVQLFYQMGLAGRRDMPMAPDARSGFEMLLLRMLAFKPVGVAELPQQTLAQTAAEAPAAEPIIEQAAPPQETAAVKKIEPTPVASKPSDTPPWETQPEAAKPVVSAATAIEETVASPAALAEPVAVVETPVVEEAQGVVAQAETLMRQAASHSLKEMVASVDQVSEPVKVIEKPEPAVAINTPAEAEKPASSVADMLAKTAPAEVLPVSQPAAKVGADRVAVEDRLPLTAEHWSQLYLQMPLNGVLRNIASNCVLQSFDGKQADFILDQSQATLFNDGHKQRLAGHLSDYLQTPIGVEITVGALTAESPAQQRSRHLAEQMRAAVELIDNDPNIALLRQQFGAEVLPESIRPVMTDPA
ncbi:Holliday junction ATP-dependent DNA helicase RuvB [Sinobacterium norvegicum]|uniref:DNA polymerase III subunit gamma/tau n=1 Tax=Sinobacterium norvegicum TaxID=1641715 RepID=A0ABM9AAC3_9GAMM|nr:DNA polymerase III subunit gamma/tau [Sinobacterium norvegicum]CAH0989949.1 Holliday junction ATP-dependent DNA helicase RuvB [Sinobacterium norvegicum]